MLNIVIPVGGKGKRFYDAGYTIYKPFLPVGNKTMLGAVIENVTPSCPHRFFFACRPEDVQTITKLAPKDSVIVADTEPRGAASGVVLLLDKMAQDDEVMVVNSDGLFDLDIDDFLSISSVYDGCILTFPADDPKWSFVKLTFDNLVCEVAEKKVISLSATAGIYYWKTSDSFRKACQSMVDHDYRINGDFYVCPVYNFMPRHLRVGVYNIADTSMHGLGTPEDYENYLEQKGLK